MCLTQVNTSHGKQHFHDTRHPNSNAHPYYEVPQPPSLHSASKKGKRPFLSAWCCIQFWRGSWNCWLPLSPCLLICNCIWKTTGTWRAKGGAAERMKLSESRDAIWGGLSSPAIAPQCSWSPCSWSRFSHKTMMAWSKFSTKKGAVWSWAVSYAEICMVRVLWKKE